MLLLRQLFSIATLTCLMLVAAPLPPADAIPAGKDRQTVRVVMDSNYPPFVFRDSSGRPQGILIDQWRLWERKTGIRVEISALDWGEALGRMEAGEFDVIDTIFFNADRAKLFDFGKAYAKLEVPIFFHKNISGISNAASLRGFAVAVKSGDATIEVLKRHGVDQLIEFKSYEEIVRAARQQQVMVFAIDKPLALYYLYKMGLQDQFWESPPLYVGEFHRAVKKGDKALLAEVEEGFARISPAELSAIDRKWQGGSLIDLEFFKYMAAAAAAIIMLVLGLFVWNRILQKKVIEKTAAHAEELLLNSQRAEELRQSEEKLRMLNLELEQRVADRTAELESALRQTESFAYSISHDLRAPLTAIDGFVQILVEDYGPQFAPEIRQHLARISRNVKKMGALIDDILTFSRLSMQPLRRQLVEPAMLVREVMAELRNDEAGREIDLMIGALPPCQADLALLRQVLINLLSNALKFSRKRNPACIEVGSRQDEGIVVYYVKDNGAGFEMAYASKLFGVFQRFHFSEEFEGTGVGLAIVRNIVERHGGRVWAESKPASGTTLYFTLGSGL